MSWHWSELEPIADDVLIAAGLVVLVVRQFLWRVAELRRMLRLPAIIVAAGLGYLVLELRAGFRWVPGDWIVAGDLALVALTGTAMGCVTTFRTAGGRLQYRLTTAGLGLWLVFVAIRVGSFALAAAVGANLADATGLVLLSFGLNRLAAITVVRRRAQRILDTARGDLPERSKS
ncbi:hypothetical protein [Amycolatopsis sp. NPDC051903]|uniref:hypothetical protein n=1 Tax=Amycolatopsis sp. NPDC051903 TaxID=3363936 RepID=UPI0037A26505